MVVMTWEKNKNKKEMLTQKKKIMSWAYNYHGHHYQIQKKQKKNEETQEQQNFENHYNTYKKLIVLFRTLVFFFKN